MSTFEDARRAVDAVDGWMSDGQARWLWDAAASVGDGGRIVEIGSFHGRSMIVMARAAGPSVELVAIDPHGGGDRGPQEITPDAERGELDHERFLANLSAAGVADRVRHVRKMSDDAHPDVDDPIDLLYIDGAHRFGPAREDIVSWGARVRAGGTLLIHDSFSSVGVTLAILTTLFGDGAWTYRGRTGSMTRYDRVPAGNRNANVLRQARELPWFVRNVIVKALIVARLGSVARLLGHDGETWPY